MRVTKSVTLERVTEIVQTNHRHAEDGGVCVACGAEPDCVESDAENYECESCGENAVFGAEQLLIYYVPGVGFRDVPDGGDGDRLTSYQAGQMGLLADD